MNRLCLITVGLFCAVAWVQLASADETLSSLSSPAQPSFVRPHLAKAKVIKAALSKAGSLSDLPFSDPYAPPVGAGKIKRGSPEVQRAVPIEPQGGFSLTAGPDGPGGSYTGGVKLRF
jgi:hypothetical protein